jgi:phage-related protein (TIGR01555 family)
MTESAAVPAVAPVKRRGGMLGALAKVTIDGWLNILTGLGTRSKDKRLSSQIDFDIMSETECEQLYGASDVASTIVDTLPEEALREWLTVQFGDDKGGAAEDDETGAAGAKSVEDKLHDLGAQSKFEEVWRFARMYGGSGILLGLDDSKQLEEPVDPLQVRSVNSMTVLSRFELVIGDMTDIDLDMQSPRYGQPLYYRFHPRRGGAQGAGLRIHHSRILRFDGAKLPIKLFISNRYWGDSVLNRTRNAIRNYETSHDAVATILQEFNQGVFKIKGLADMLENGQDDAVQKRMQTIQLSRSICRAIVIDQDEEFTNIGAAVTGIDGLLQQVGGRLVVSSHMPHDKILGDSPSGLGATGESENRVWYDYVAAQRELVLRPKIEYLAKLILASRRGPTSGKVPEKWSFKFNPLWQHDEVELSNIRKTQAETDVAYINANVLDPDEVAVSRFGRGKYSTETTIDLEARAAQQAAAEAEQPPATGGTGDPLPGARPPSPSAAKPPEAGAAKAPPPPGSAAQPATTEGGAK